MARAAASVCPMSIFLSAGIRFDKSISVYVQRMPAVQFISFENHIRLNRAAQCAHLRQHHHREMGHMLREIFFGICLAYFGPMNTYMIPHKIYISAIDKWGRAYARIWSVPHGIWRRNTKRSSRNSIMNLIYGFLSFTCFIRLSHSLATSPHRHYEVSYKNRQMHICQC